MSRSNIGRVLEKIHADSALRESSGENSRPQRQRRFDYEDGVVSRSVEAREQIRRMHQPFVFNNEEMDARHLIHEGDDNSQVSALLKELRNQVTQSRPGLGVTVLVTSVGAADQSSVLARNLAAVLAADENHTSLLLELWDNASRLTDDEYPAPGISDFIDRDELSVGDVIAPTGIRRMRAIPFGGVSFVNDEYLRAIRLRILIKDVTRRYPRDRFTIIDAPPIDRVFDVALLNEYADQIIVCLPYGKVSITEIRKGLAKLERDKLMGTVLCGSPRMKGFFERLAK